MTSLNRLFTTPDQVKRLDTRRGIYLLLCIVSFVVTELGRNVYRPFIYQNGIDDLGLADSIGNVGGIIVQVFFSLFILNSDTRQGMRVIVFLVIGYIVYEFLQPFLPKGTFDWKDVIGTVLGGVVSAVIFYLLNKYHTNNRTIFTL